MTDPASPRSRRAAAKALRQAAKAKRRSGRDAEVSQEPQDAEPPEEKSLDDKLEEARAAAAIPPDAPTAPGEDASTQPDPAPRSADSSPSDWAAVPTAGEISAEIDTAEIDTAETDTAETDTAETAERDVADAETVGAGIVKDAELVAANLLAEAEKDAAERIAAAQAEAQQVTEQSRQEAAERIAAAEAEAERITSQAGRDAQEAGPGAESDASQHEGQRSEPGPDDPEALSDPPPAEVSDEPEVLAPPVRKRVVRRR